MRHLALMLAVLAGCGDDEPTLPPACEAPVTGTSVTFREVARTNGPAVLVTSPPDDARHFVVEQQGRIVELTDTGISTTPFLDISDRIACCGEDGLLGLAFHPRFASNGELFVFYTTTTANIVSRFTVDSKRSDVADPASETRLLVIPTESAFHHGGMIEFGNDGLLYIGVGDSVEEDNLGDPMHNGQNPNTLLAKILRIDVDHEDNGKAYAIPKDNPFASGGGAPEIAMLGVRNPWRWSFDRATGDLYLADVGQTEVEELDIIPAGKAAGLNLGWNTYEGSRCNDPPCDPAGMTMPQVEKLHSEGWCAIIGGATYRGSCFPDLVGKHLVTDLCARELVAVTPSADQVMVETVPATFSDGAITHDGVPESPTSLHADARGEIYLTAGTGDFSVVYHLEVVP